MEQQNKHLNDDFWLSMMFCAICGEIIKKETSSFLLPCCHSACWSCIAKEKTITSEIENKGLLIIHCNYCGQDVKPNDCIKNIFKLFHMESNKMKSKDRELYCQSCVDENLAFIKCNKCEWICSKCFDWHKKIKIFKEHILDFTSKIEENIDSSRVLVSNCLIHNKRKNMYCQTCSNSNCTLCIIKDHKLHVFEEINTYAKQVTAEINNLHRLVSGKMYSVNKTMEKVGNEEMNISVQRDTMVENIKVYQQIILEKIHETANLAIEHVNSVYTNQETENLEIHRKLKTVYDSLMFNEIFIKTVLKQNNNIATITATDLIKKQLIYLLNKPCPQLSLAKSFNLHVSEDDSKTLENILKICFEIIQSYFKFNKTAEKRDGSHEFSEIAENSKIIGSNLIKNTFIVNKNALISSTYTTITKPFNSSKAKHNTPILKKMLSSPTLRSIAPKSNLHLLQEQQFIWMNFPAHDFTQQSISLTLPKKKKAKKSIANKA